MLFADPVAVPLVKIFAWLGIHPNLITLSTLVPFVFSCYFFIKGTGKSLVVGAVLWQISWILDCVDGKLAKYSDKMTKLGAKLDARLDFTRKFFAMASLVYGIFGKKALLHIGIALFVLHYTIHFFSHHVWRINRYRDTAYVTPFERRIIKRVGEFYTSYDEQFFMLFIAPFLAGVFEGRELLIMSTIWTVASVLYLIKSLSVYKKYRR